jgi:hypothetical protein
VGPAAVVVGGNRRHLELAHPQALPRSDPAHTDAARRERREQVLAAGRHYDRHQLVQRLERRQVEMVEVGVADQHRIDRAELGGRHRRLEHPARDRAARAQVGIQQQFGTAPVE